MIFLVELVEIQVVVKQCCDWVLLFNFLVYSYSIEVVVGFNELKLYMVYKL